MIYSYNGRNNEAYDSCDGSFGMLSGLVVFPQLLG